MDVSKNRGTPKWMMKIMENPIKMDDLGVPLFLEMPMYIYIYIYIYYILYIYIYTGSSIAVCHSKGCRSYAWVFCE